MNKSLIAIGAALSAIGVISVAPAEAGTLTFDFELDASSQVTFNSGLGGLTLEGVTIPDSLQVTADKVVGSFTVLDDPAQVTDGSLDLGSDFLDDALLSSTYNAMLESLLGDYGLTTSEVVQSVDDLFSISQFTGDGELTSKDFTLVNDTTAFDITYDDSTNAIAITGYDTDVAESCLSTTCLIDDVNLSFDVNLVLSEFINVTNELLTNSSISLSPETSEAIANLQQMAFFAQFLSPTLNLATVELESFSAITSFDSSDPTGTDLDIEVTDGVITATTITGTEEEEIFSESFGSPEDSTQSLTVVATPADVVKPTAVILPSETSPWDSADPVTDPVTVTTKPTAVTNTPGGSLTITTSGPIKLADAAAISTSDAQDVPEPSILIGLLGTAVLVKRGRKQTPAQ